MWRRLRPWWLLPALGAGACAFDYDGAFGGGAGGFATTGTVSSGGVFSTNGATTTGFANQVSSTVSGFGGAGGQPSSITVGSSTVGQPCVCAPPGSCDGANDCICPGSVTLDRYPTIGEGTAAGNQGWVDVANATAPDTMAATVHLGPNQHSEQLTVRGFDFSSVPDDAALTAIHVEIDRCRTVETGPVDVTDEFLRLSNAGVPVGAETILRAWGVCGGAGGAYDFATAGLSPANLKNDFGVQLRIKNATGTADAYLNTVKVTVSYAPTCVP